MAEHTAATRKSYTNAEIAKKADWTATDAIKMKTGAATLAHGAAARGAADQTIPIQDKLAEYIDAQETARVADDSLFALLKEMIAEFDAVNKRIDEAQSDID